MSAKRHSKRDPPPRRSARGPRSVAYAAACLLTFTASPAGALDPARSLAQLHNTHWSLQDGMPGHVNAMAQTPDGFLWLGTSSGLYRFDGVRAERITVGALANRAINALTSGTSGDLWIGFTDPKIGRLQRGELSVFDVPPHPNQGAVFYLVPDPDGSVWVGLRNRVLNFNGRRWKPADGPWPPAATFSQPGGVWGLARAPDGTLWAKNLLGLYYLRRGAPAFEPASGYGGGLLDFARDRDGRIWTADFATRRFYALPDVPPGRPAPPPALLGAPVPPSVLASIMLDRDGGLWNSNRVTGGLYRLPSVTAPGAPERFLPIGRTVDLAPAMLEDREGAVWVGSVAGLDRFRPANIVGEPDLRIRAQAAGIVATPQAVYAYSGMGARVADPSDPGRRLYRIRPGEPPEVVARDIGQLQAIAASPEGDLVLAREGRLLRWRDGKVIPIAMPPDLEGGHVASLVATRQGGVVVAIHGRGVWRLEDGAWTVLARTGSNELRIATDAAGAVWLFQSDGEISRYTRDGATTFPRALAARLGYVQALLPDRDGALVLGNFGIGRFDGQTLQILAPPRAPPLGHAAGMAQTPDGDIWMLTEGGVARIDRDKLMAAFRDPAARLDYQIFDAGDGFKGAPAGDLFNSSMVTGPDGRVWMLLFDRVAWIDPKRLYRNTRPPPVVIRAARAGERTWDMPARLKLPPGASQLQIDYTAPALAAPERIRFRYRLEGVDKDWVEAGARRQAFYTNLQPGDYRFQVIAANGDGVWNTTGATLAFTLAPTFWQSWVFKGLVALVAAGALWGLYRLRLRQVSERILARLAERMDERERIARELHDTLLQAFHGLTLKLQALTQQMPPGQPARRLMEEALDRADEVLAEGRDRVRHLRTQRAEGDLPEALGAMMDRLRLDPSVEMGIQVAGERRPLHPVVLDEVLGVAGEALFNAFKHAQAEHVTAQIRYGRRELVVRIADDGAGVAAGVLEHGREGHFGLAGMRERARKIRGHLELRSRPGEGVEVILTVPAGHAFARTGRRWGPFASSRLELED